MNSLKVCTRCVMDDSAQNIVFDSSGFCNFCTEYLESQKHLNKSVSARISQKDGFIARVKANGKGKEYDCIVGVSGGVDSSYALYLAVKSGLRPLAVHLDNGWNSELAVHNISNLVNQLKVDLFTHVIDWEENKDLQRSFFKANVVDIEMLMDNAMQALNFKLADKYGLKYILAGTNQVTEGFSFPVGWNHFKRDKKNIINIQKKFGSKRIKTHPLIGTFEYIYYRFFKSIIWESFLDYFQYNKEAAVKLLVEEYGYKPYPYKHYESVFTRFYQGYILPIKFNVDKRKMHLSNLICSDQISREQALENLKQDPYPDKLQRESDKEFVLKKLGFTDNWFDTYLKSPKVDHEVYGTEIPLWNWFESIYRKIRPR